MAQSGARSVDAGNTTDGSGVNRGVTGKRTRDGLTPAQLYCLLAGAALLLAGIFGFIADSTFDTGSTNDPEGGNVGGALQGDSFLGFEVNGWHNVVHLLSGLLLLASFKRRDTAKTVALAFGVVYGLVAIIGLIDGNDVLGIIPVNPADNILHIALSLVGIISALASPKDQVRGGHGTTGDTGTVRDERFDRSDDTIGTTTDPMTGRPFGDRVNR
jgi:hypothetical protein